MRAPEVRAAAAYVTAVPGGRGAVRDAIEWLLKLRGGGTRLVATCFARRVEELA